MTVAFPKPSQRRQSRPATKAFRDGREVCDLKTKAGMDLYRARVKEMLARQNGKCGLMITPQCRLKNGKLSLEMATFEHTGGRGHGGGKRDDRIEVDGKPQNMAACPWCNSMKGSRPLSDFSGDVIP